MKLKSLLTLAVVCLVAGVVYAGDPTTELNIDLGDVFFGDPSDAYGAASGQTGRWNSVGLLVTTDLLDTAASSTAVSISVDADSAGGAAGQCLNPDDQALMDDNIFTYQGTWTVILAGLANGFYEVYLYAPTHPSAATGNMVVNGVFVASIPGSLACEFSFGVSTVRMWVEVLNGTISLVGDWAQTGFDNVGLAGLQLRGPVDIFADGFESGDTTAWSSTVD